MIRSGKTTGGKRALVTLGTALPGAALLGWAALDLWRVLWLDELWRLPRGGILAALGGLSIGVALQAARQSINALLVAGSIAACVALAAVAQAVLGLDVATAIESRVLRAKKLAKAEREIESLAVRPIDLRPRLEIIETLRRAGIEAWPSPFVLTLGNLVDAGILPLHPLGGIANVWVDRMLVEMRRAGIEILDSDPLIRASGDPDQFFPETHQNPHYNARGYAMLADLLRGALAKRGGIRVVEATLGRSCLGVAPPPPLVNNVRIGNLTRTLAARCAGERACALPLVEHGFVGDPAPGCPADVEAIWRCDGKDEQRRFYVAPEKITADTVIRLACPKL